MKTVSIAVSLLFASASVVVADETTWTCNPLSGENDCDITTACINTGPAFLCACRAGYKASPNNDDLTQQFRLVFPNYEFLVFTPTQTSCNVLCDNHLGPATDLCSEVPAYTGCPVAV